MKDLSPASWAALAEEFLTNDGVWEKWFYNYYTRVTTHGACDASCKAVICLKKHDSHVFSVCIVR
jgi:hypothetical protein